MKFSFCCFDSLGTKNVIKLVLLCMFLNELPLPDIFESVQIVSGHGHLWHDTFICAMTFF